MDSIPRYTLRELTDRYFIVYWYRKHLDIAAKDLLGLDLAPHHSLILRDWSTNKPINHLISSRGMGKSVLLAIYYLLISILYPSLKSVVAAGTAFRGAKMVLMEVERIINGHLSGQDRVEYAKASLLNTKKPLYKDPSYWYVVFINGSTIYGIPLSANTGGEAVRGLRAHKLGMDEAYLIPNKVQQAVLDPMQNVVYDMTKPANEQLVKNSKISVSTIDFDFRDFWVMGEYYRMLLEGSQPITKIEENIRAEDISYFNFNMDDAFYTYKGKRRTLWSLDIHNIMRKKTLPNIDLSIWLAENKNIPMNIQGSYFSYPDIEAGMRTVLYQGDETTPQVLDVCSGQCILGVDTAPSGDNTAFTIIKIGSYSQTKDLEICQTADMGGPCPLLKGKNCLYKRFTSVIYSFQENKMSQQDRVKKIYELLQRYNIVAIAMDFRGGGSELSDLLKDKKYIDSAINNDPELGIRDALPIYDPENDSGIVGLPILKMYSTTQADNLLFNGYLKALINNQQLLFPLPLHERPTNIRVLEAAGHIETLIAQLARIRAVPRGKSVSFEIETIDAQSGRHVPAKKDLYSSLLYAVARLREFMELDMKTTTYKEELLFPVGFNC